MKNIATLIVLLISTITFSQDKETGIAFINALLEKNDYTKAYSYFDQTIQAQISETLLKETIEKTETQLGKFKAIIAIQQEEQTYYYYSEFTNMKLDIAISFGSNHKIIGFFFVAHKEHNKENTLGEALNIQSNTISLQGTLLQPANDTLKKLVIFVHGSGPNDRDETIFENKPFKDIAESLYKKGITSYRFDKRSYSNPETFNNQSTIDDEVTNDIVNIITYFKNNEKYKNHDIVLLGHSLGAYMLPRIANQSNKISKIILLAGNARPLDELIMEQYDYLYALDPSPALKEAKEKIKQQIKFLNSKSFQLNTPSKNLPLDLSAYYWKSIKDYDPIKEVQKVKTPLLLLQGERDYQVTMKDFQLWKKALQNNPKATFKSYPTLNHLFMTGGTPSDPKEYQIKSTVNTAVITDIYNFIK